MKTWKVILALMAMVVLLVLSGPLVAPAEILPRFEGVAWILEVHSGAAYGPAPSVEWVAEAVAEHLANAGYDTELTVEDERSAEIKFGLKKSAESGMCLIEAEDQKYPTGHDFTAWILVKSSKKNPSYTKMVKFGNAAIEVIIQGIKNINYEY